MRRKRPYRLLVIVSINVSLNTGQLKNLIFQAVLLNIYNAGRIVI